LVGFACEAEVADAASVEDEADDQSGQRRLGTFLKQAIYVQR